MPAIKQRYGTLLSKTLVKRLEQIDRDANAQLSLREEAKHVEATYHDVLAQYGEALELYELATSTGDVAALAKARAVRDDAGALLREVNKEVREAVMDAAKIEAVIGRTFSAASVREIIAECVRTVYELCGDLHNGADIAEQFELMIRERVQVGDVVTGTTITPHALDMDVTAMINTVPRA